ncbi:MAG: DUF6263 family protein [Candidatus Eremiobacteraeota bacterium]|nr:DUF6263 family protein [Candidatus Eremiobacteraeota bacterium]
MKLSNEMSLGEKKLRISMDMMMEGLMKVKEISKEGVASFDMSFTRITMNCTEPSPVSFDSDNDADMKNPQFTSLSLITGKDIPVKVTDRGEVKEIDMQVFYKALESGIDTAMKDKLRENIEYMTKSSFIQLCRDPVKAGDTYDAGVIVQPLAKIGEISTSVSYRILSVSGDKKQAVIKPICRSSLKVASSGPVKAGIDSDKFEGWILFDLEKGNIMESSAETQRVMSISEGAKTMKVKTGLTMQYAVQYQ